MHPCGREDSGGSTSGADREWSPLCPVRDPLLVRQRLPVGLPLEFGRRHDPVPIRSSEPARSNLGSMEFQQVVGRRRMVRSFASEPVPRDLILRLLAAARRGPSAGFAQGTEFVVLNRPEELDRFWAITDPNTRKRNEEEGAPPLIVIPCANMQAYLRRYSEPDKAGYGMETEGGWPVPYWVVDAAMATMLLLLAAVDEGLGAWFFGIFRGEDELMEWIGAPKGCRPIGAVALGYAHPSEKRRGSVLSRRRRRFEDQVHFGGWDRGPGSGAAPERHP